MSTQRYIETSFWDDTWVQELDPSEKLLYIYLLTNPLTNIAGVMELTVKRMCFDTGFNSDTINHILAKFEKARKVFRFENYIIIRNFPKHQKITSEKILKGIAFILAKLPANVLCYLEKIDYQLDIKEMSRSLGITYPEHQEEPEPVKSKQSSEVKAEPPKRVPLIEREPKNDIEKVEKVYLLNYQSLYERGIVKNQKPIINWTASRKLTSDSIEKYGLETIIEAVKKSINNQFVISKGYVLTTILSAGVLAQLVNAQDTRGIANDALDGTETICF